MDKENVLYPYNMVSFNEELIIHFFYNIDEPQKYLKWKMLETIDYKMYVSNFIKCLEKEI